MFFLIILNLASSSETVAYNGASGERQSGIKNWASKGKMLVNMHTGVNI